MNKKAHGFTIVELLIVIVIIAILAAISIVAYRGIQQRATDSAIASKESQAKKKLALYKIDNDAYPSSQAIFDTLIGQTPSDDLYTTYTSSSPYSTYTLSTTAGGSPTIACDTGYIPVPGNSTFGTSDFCVMKYEAKNVGGVATSQATGTPWVSISQTSAITTAQAACSGCHLITEAEWMTIAANVLSVASNWSGGSVGSGYIYRGHSDSTPGNTIAASVNDNDGYADTGNSNGSQRRTLALTNGETIWDFAGNATEWTDATISSGQQPGYIGESAYAWKEWNNNSVQWNALSALSRPSAISAAVSGYSSTQQIGEVYSNYGETTAKAFRRGGDWNGGLGSGVLSLNLVGAPSSTDTRVGFRVAK